MKLYLVQHAKPKEEDPERHLSEKGIADVKKVAAFVAESIEIKTIVHSGKARAKQTAEILGDYLRAPEIKGAEDLKPLADPSVWATRLAKIDEDLMIVGHLPHLSKLCSILVGEDKDKKVVNFQMGGVVCLERDEMGSWCINWIVIPELMS
jgi:phosphohistidine phosphatase